jgi:putative endonuclease
VSEELGQAGGRGLTVEARGVAYVYLLRCADDSLYCGWTVDVERRLAAHRSGAASHYTRSRRPVELALVLSVADRSAALREEHRIKRLPRAAKLRLIERAQSSLGPVPTTCDRRASPATCSRQR